MLKDMEKLIKEGRNKGKMRKIKKKREKGITLVALVVTIVILLILAGVSISMLTGENGIISNAIQAKEKHLLTEEKERLEMVKAEYSLEKYKGDKELTIEDFIEKLVEQGIVEREDIKDNGDGTYEIETNNGYIVTIGENEETGDIEIKIEGKVESVHVKINKLTLTSTSNSIKVDVITKWGENATYKYYIKKNNETDYPKDPKYEGTESTYTITGLEEGTYKVKVVAKDKKGKSEKEESITTKEIEIATGVINITNLTWDETTHKASVTVTNTKADQYSMQYAITTGSITTDFQEIANNGVITGLELNQTVVVRLWDGTNYGTGTITYLIKDQVSPTNPSLSVISGTAGNNGWYRSNVTITIIPGTDNESGVDKTTYTITGAQTASETIGTTVTITAEGTSTITAYTYDKAGNKSLAGTITIKKDTVGPTFSGLVSKTVTGSYSDSAFKEGVTVTDATSGISSNTAFTYTPTSLVNGENTITYTATDNAGNTTTQTIVITYSGMVCFVAGTKVSTVDGLRNIEDLKVGDIVFSYNEETQKVEEKEVIGTTIKEINILGTVTFENGEKIQNTIEHAYYVINKGWKETKDLQIGDKVLTQNKTIVKVTNLEINKVETTKVYNLTVKDNHNYFVGIFKYLVHNVICGS